MFANGALQHFALNSLQFFFEGDFADATNFRIYGRPQQRELRPPTFCESSGFFNVPY